MGLDVDTPGDSPDMPRCETYLFRQPFVTGAGCVPRGPAVGFDQVACVLRHLQALLSDDVILLRLPFEALLGHLVKPLVRLAAADGDVRYESRHGRRHQ